MKPALLLALVVALPALASPPPGAAPGHHRYNRDHRAPRHDGYQVVCPRDVDAAVADFDLALQDMADDIERLRGKDRRRLLDSLAALADAAEEVRDRACERRPIVVVPPPPPPPPPRSFVISQTEHRAVLETVRRENFDDDKVRTLEVAYRGDQCLNSVQVADYIRLMDFSSNKLDVFRRLAPRLVDDGQNLTLLNAFDFASQREDARQVLLTAKRRAACALPFDGGPAPPPPPRR
jgi:hypothetical protein